MSERSAWDGIEGIVMDAVGTLIEPVPPVAAVYRAAAERQGLRLAEDEVRTRFQVAFLGDESAETLGTLETSETIEFGRWRRIVANVLPEVPDPEHAFRELWDHFGTPNAWRCYADVGPAIARLRSRGLTVRIASNFDARLHGIVAGLEELGACDLPVISSEVGYRKPHAAFYAAVCKRLGLAPDRVLSVGDDLDNDVRGAARAGFRSLWLDRRHSGKGERFPRISSLDELCP